MLQPERKACFNMWTLKPPLRKLEKSRGLFFLYIALISVSFVLFETVIVPNTRLFWYQYAVLSIYSISFIFYMIIVFKDPGTIKGQDTMEFTKRLAEVDCKSLCPYCQIVVTP